MDELLFHNMKLTWLNGGVTALDGGAMFGVVPKALWSRKYPVNEKNQIELACEPILVQYEGKNYLIDSGVGFGKLNEKQLRNFGVSEESEILESLKDVGLSAADIDAVLMTHLHFDHFDETAMQVMDGHLSVRETERLVKKVLSPEKENDDKEWKKADQFIYDKWEEDLQISMGTKVSIKRKNKDKGHIMIDYYSTDELERLMEMLSKL